MHLYCMFAWGFNKEMIQTVLFLFNIQVSEFSLEIKLHHIFVYLNRCKFILLVLGNIELTAQFL